MSPKLTIRKAEVSDADQFLKFMKQVGGETDMLLTDENGLPFTVAQEAALIAETNNSQRNILLAALIDGQIIGACGLRTNPQPRLQHWANLGMSVSKKYWRQGVGTALMEAAIRFAKSIKLDSITLEVRSDNHAAIALYEKFGFEKYAHFKRHFYIRGEYFDAHLMRLQL